MAASVHGVVRASLDADAVISLSLSALPRLERTFQAAGFQTELRRGDADDPIGSLLELRDEFGNRVDLLVGLAHTSADSVVDLRLHPASFVHDVWHDADEHIERVVSLADCTHGI
jgi:hypothetical protein